MSEYPFEGDLAPIIENVTVPRVLRETVAEMWAQLGEVIGVPDISAADAELGGLSDELWWAQRMAEKGRH